MAKSEKKSINLIQTAEVLTAKMFGEMPGRAAGGGKGKGKSVAPKPKKAKKMPPQKEVRQAKKARKTARTAARPPARPPRRP